VGGLWRCRYRRDLASILLAWISSADTAQLVARALGGRGTFEDTLAMFGLGIGVASWATGLHDVVTTFTGYPGGLDQQAYEDAMNTAGAWPNRLIRSLMLVYLFGFLALFTRGSPRPTGSPSHAQCLSASPALPSTRWYS
jgi:hypothetical protein